MGFLAPLGLLAALLALPILALYFLRLRRRERRVSSTLLWRLALEEVQARSPWRRLRRQLLLFLQLLALAMLVLALARPFIERAGETAGDQVVLIDLSASMQATDVAPSRFEAARARAAALIDGLGPGDHMTLIGLADVPQVLVTDSADRVVLRRALDGLRPTAGGADLEAALSLVNSLRQATSGGRGGRPLQVRVLSDGNVGPATNLPPLTFPVFYEAIGTPAENLAIAAFATRRVEGKTAALARISNTGLHPQDTAVELSADGLVIDTRPVSVQPAGEEEVTWPELPDGVHVLQVHLTTHDALPLDDAAWAVVGGGAHARALLVTPGNIFLERALALHPALEVTRVAPEAYANLAGGAPGYDLVVFDGTLPDPLPNGAVLVLAPPAASTPFPIGEPVGVERVSPGTAGGDVLRYVDVRDVHIAQARRLSPPPTAQEVLTSPATPLVVTWETRERRLALFGFDVHDSDLPLQPAFPILIQNLVNWLVPGLEDQPATLRPGETVRAAVRPEAEAVWAVQPDGRRVDLAPPFPAAPLAATDQLGPYRLVQRLHGAERIDYVAVNLFSPQESKLEPAARLALPPSAPEAAEGLSPPRPVPLEIWPWLALLGLIVLFGEWWAYQRGHA